MPRAPKPAAKAKAAPAKKGAKTVVPEVVDGKAKPAKGAKFDLSTVEGVLASQAGLLYRGRATPNLKPEALPFGLYDLDRNVTHIGGGPRGRIIEVVGNEASGKSTLCLKLIAMTQAAGHECAYIDAEHALDGDWAALQGVDMDALVVGKPEWGEQALDLVQALLMTFKITLIVVDSVAALVPKKELEGDMGDSIMGVHAKLMSQALRKLTALVEKSNALLVFTNQYRCLAASSLVPTPSGLVTVGSISAGDIVYTPEGLPTKVTAVSLETGHKEQVTLTAAGNVTHMSLGHRIPVLNPGSTIPDLIPAREIKVGDFIPLPRVQLWRDGGMDLVSSARMSLLGMWFADGCVMPDYKRVTFSFKREALTRSAAKIVAESGLPCSVHVAKTGHTFFNFHGASYDWFRSHDLAQGARNKLIPRAVRTPSEWAAFLRGFFDMHLIGNGEYLGFQLHVDNPLAAIEVREAIHAFGIATTHSTAQRKTGVTTRITITGKDAIAYLDRIGPPHSIINLDALIPDDTSRGKQDVVPCTTPLLNLEKSFGGKSQTKRYRRLSAAAFQGLNASWADYASIMDEASLPYIRARWVRVDGVAVGPVPTDDPLVDLEVEDSEHLFIGGGIISHNSTMSSFGPGKTTTGGNALKFYAALRLETTNVGKIKEGGSDAEDALVIGNEIRITALKNKMGPPWRVAKIPLLHTSGYDNAGSLFELCVKNGLECIVQEGVMWVVFGVRCRGRAAAVAASRAYEKEMVRALDDFYTSGLVGWTPSTRKE